MAGKSNKRIAVVGAGLIGRKHIEVVAEYATLDAIIDPDPAAKELAENKQAAWYEALEYYLAANNPDGAILATPNTLHRTGGEACLRAGVPVLIEKPLADGTDEGQGLVDAEKDTGTRILVGHHRRHSPIAQQVKSVLDSGRLGPLVVANALFWLNKPADYFDADWRTKTGGGPTYINLIHDIDLLQYFCGPITCVQAREASATRGFEVEDTSAVILEFASGVLGTVSICDTTSAPWSWELTAGENPAYPKTDQSCYMLGGTLGSISVPDLKVWTHTGEQSWWSPIECDDLGTPNEDPILSQFRHFLDVIDGAAPRVTAEDGLRNIRVLDAIKAAAKTGGTVPV